jgi:D-alanyl-D-alanine carboxypeptidase
LLNNNKDSKVYILNQAIFSEQGSKQHQYQQHQNGTAVYNGPLPAAAGGKTGRTSEAE